MAMRRFSSKPPPGLSSELAADDGVDPRFDTKHPPAKVTNRKARQLCRQVERVLSVALEGELLRDLLVEDVLPAPDSSRLIVKVRFLGPAEVPKRDILAALHSERARLRALVAASTHRRKTPELEFELVR